MMNTIDNIVIFLALAYIGWGAYRAQAQGKREFLVWCQRTTFTIPWLLLLASIVLNLPINLALVVGILVLSFGGYISLGRQIRQMDALMPPPPPPASPLSSSAETSTPTVDPADSAAPEAAQPVESDPVPAPRLSPIPAETIQRLEGIFGIDTFFRTETVPYADGVIFNGNLRGDSAAVHQSLTDKMTAMFDQEYQLFLVYNPQQKPVVIVLPREEALLRMGRGQKIFAVALAVATLITCLTTSALLQEFDLFAHPERLSEALPIGLGLFSVLIAHEVGHHVQARKHGIRLSWPFFFPALQLGSFGAFNRFESILPNRTVLFDIAVAGPAAGGFFSLLLLLMGFSLSNDASALTVQTPFFQGSILVGLLARLGLGGALHAETVQVHYFVIVGWLGLIITALNLMPAGCLDGGRLTQAIYGRRVAGQSTVVTLILLAVVSFFNPLALYWAIVVLLLQRDLERPSLDELSEPDDRRAAIALLALFVMITILIPLNNSLALRLGIGG